MIKSTELEVWGLNQSGTLRVKLKSGALENVFPNMTGVQNRDSQVLTYVVAFVNQNASLALTSAKIYFRVVASGGANLSMALDPLGAVAKTGNVWSPTNPPVAFTAPTTIAAGLSVPTLNPGFAISVWIRRTGNASVALRPERNTITITGSSLA